MPWLDGVDESAARAFVQPIRDVPDDVWERHMAQVMDNYPPLASRESSSTRPDFH